MCVVMVDVVKDNNDLLNCFHLEFFCLFVCFAILTGYWVFILEVLVGLHRTIQLQLLQHYWLGHRLGLL